MKVLLADLSRKSASLSRSLSSADPVINEMLRVADTGWQARSDAGFERHAIMDALLDGGRPSHNTLEGIAEYKGPRGGHLVDPWPAIPGWPNFPRP